MDSKFVRLNELGSLHRKNVNSYFHKSRDDVKEEQLFENQFLLIEDELCDLDIESWNFLKNEASPLCVQTDRRRGWTKLFEKLNEAKGYGFLKSEGYSNICFIPRSKKGGVETPDLKGERDTSIALCEVKTKNISDELITAKENSTVYRSKHMLTDGLRSILKSTFEKAESQLNSYTKYSNPEKYIYLVIEYDDDLFFRQELNVQTRELFNSMNLMDINLVIHLEK